MPDNSNYVTHAHLAAALDKFGDKISTEMRNVAQELRTQIASDRGELKAQLVANKPQSSTVAAWASVSVTVVCCLVGGVFFHLNSQRGSDLAASAEYHRMQEAKNDQIFKVLMSDKERNENLRDADSEDIKRRYRDSLNHEP